MAEEKRFLGPEFSKSFFAQNPLKNASALGLVIQRKYAHEAHTGHKVSRPDFQKR
jgi:hypothetical protein